jgi:hypothetical protein
MSLDKLMELKYMPSLEEKIYRNFNSKQLINLEDWEALKTI